MKLIIAGIIFLITTTLFYYYGFCGDITEKTAIWLLFFASVSLFYSAFCFIIFFTREKVGK